jgi:hypothetical protein
MNGAINWHLVAVVGFAVLAVVISVIYLYSNLRSQRNGGAVRSLKIDQARNRKVTGPDCRG